jgi:hypothetical protein
VVLPAGQAPKPRNVGLGLVIDRREAAPARADTGSRVPVLDVSFSDFTFEEAGARLTHRHLHILKWPIPVESHYPD